MRKKVLLAIFIIAILIASISIGYYVTYLAYTPLGNPSLVYDFYQAISSHSSSFLGWNVSGSVSYNWTGADSIMIDVRTYPDSSLFRQFRALSPSVSVGFDWSEGAILFVNRTLNGVYNTFTSPFNSLTTLTYTNTTTFNVDNGTIFTVQFGATYPFGFVYRVRLWNSAELS